MSGGVDSSVTAALLQQQGYEVIGMMMRLWSEPGTENENRCCTPDSMAQARKVAAILSIPFYAVDAQTYFHDTIVDYFIKSHARGITPNPCLVCNRYVRWDFLLNHALDLGADFMATGHYVRISKNDSEAFELRKAVDEQKDQSYVLHVLQQAQLRHALFPLGDYTKPEVRKMAESFNLPIAHRPDSQDLCFLGSDDYRNFLKRNAPDIQKAGLIKDREGNIFGEHTGLANYTIGQRKGLGGSSPVPLYVLAKDINENTLVVGTREELGQKKLIAGPVNWTSGKSPDQPIRAQIKIRYKAQPVWGTIDPLSEDRVEVVFDEPLRDITPGQAAVFYDGELVLGGGLITGG